VIQIDFVKIARATNADQPLAAQAAQRLIRPRDESSARSLGHDLKNGSRFVTGEFFDCVLVSSQCLLDC
jgi:hypothetical protein